MVRVVKGFFLLSLPSKRDCCDLFANMGNAQTCEKGNAQMCEKGDAQKGEKGNAQKIINYLPTFHTLNHRKQ